ncbi:MAG: hypothetical protein AAF664_18720 [Planctomycetota bacterium]
MSIATSTDEATIDSFWVIKLSKSPDEWLVSVERDMAAMRRQIRLQLQARLDEWVGFRCSDVESAAKLAKAVQKLLDQHGLRASCPYCGHPAVVRQTQRGDRVVFVFDHTIDGKRTFHGGRAEWPKIKLVAKPERKRRSA